MNNKTVIYLLRRLVFYLLAGFMAVSLNFLIPRMMPGDAASIMFAQFRGKMPIENLQALKQTFGFPEAEPFVDDNNNQDNDGYNDSYQDDGYEKDNQAQDTYKDSYQDDYQDQDKSQDEYQDQDQDNYNDL